MFIAITVALVLISVVLHELGHAFAMRSKGIDIEAIGLGLGPAIATFGPFRCRFGSATTFSLRLLPIGAYVKPSGEGQREFKNLSYSDKAHILGAGVLANCGFAFLLVMLLDFTHPRLFSNAFMLKLALVSGVGTILLRFGRKFIVPLAGCALLGETVFAMITAGPKGAVMGPVALGSFVAQNALGLPQAVLIAAVISLALCLTNMLPIWPFDGGLTVRALIVKVMPRLTPAYDLLAVPGFMALIACVVLSEFSKR
ncbi:MAG TPA: site-2 protease family protein [Candidatus Paceibacterota bacterium]|nr:site-2 protease family protein [Candidatus Paceibacterota bacterium]